MRRIKILDLRPISSKILYAYLITGVVILDVIILFNLDLLSAKGDIITILFMEGIYSYIVYSINYQMEKSELVYYLAFDVKNNWFELQDYRQIENNDRQLISEISGFEIVSIIENFNKLSIIIENEEDISIQNQLRLIQNQMITFDYMKRPYMLSILNIDDNDTTLMVGSYKECKKLENKLIKELNLEVLHSD